MLPLQPKESWDEISIDGKIYAVPKAKSTLFAEKKDGKLILTVTDAFMKKDLNNLTVYTSVPVAGEEVTKQKKGVYEIKVPLPTGAQCGQPATITLKLL